MHSTGPGGLIGSQERQLSDIIVLNVVCGVIEECVEESYSYKLVSSGQPAQPVISTSEI